jgi:hypothetical protein
MMNDQSKPTFTKDEFIAHMKRREALANEFENLANELILRQQNKAGTKIAASSLNLGGGVSSVVCAIALPAGVVSAPVIAAVAGIASLCFGIASIVTNVGSSVKLRADARSIEDRFISLNEEVEAIAIIDHKLIDHIGDVISKHKNPAFVAKKYFEEGLFQWNKNSCPENIKKDIETIQEGVGFVATLQEGGTVCPNHLSTTFAEGIPALGIAAGTEAATGLFGMFGGASAAFGVYNIYQGVQDLKNPTKEIVKNMKDIATKIRNESEAYGYLFNVGGDVDVEINENSIKKENKSTTTKLTYADVIRQHKSEPIKGGTYR